MITSFFSTAEKTVLYDKRYIILTCLFVLHVFLRFYAIETKSIFLYDQVDSAWAAKNIIVDHIYPLIGPENKLGSGFFVGPLYYYFIAAFYYGTDLDPIASGLFAGATSIVGYFTLFYVIKKLFSFNTSLIALFLNTVCFSAIQFDRVQWEINFVPIVSLWVFYFLYNIVNGKEKYILYLSIALALSFHVHLTAVVFLLLISICMVPFFPRTKTTLKYSFLSVPILLTGLSPIIVVNILNNNIHAFRQLTYVESSFHGVHLTRILQLAFAGFVQIESYIPFPILRPLSLCTLLLFFVIYFLNIPDRKRFRMTLLVFLYFIVPWIVLSAYRGEITDYYFSTNRYVGLMVLSYVISSLISLKNKSITALLVLAAVFYAYQGISQFLALRISTLQNHRTYVKGFIQRGEVIEFKQGSPFSYLYYFYTRKNP